MVERPLTRTSGNGSKVHEEAEDEEITELHDGYLDGGLEPDWTPPLDVGGAMIIAIRDFNRTLPENERIRVHAIDMTVDYGGGQSFLGSLGLLTRHLPDPGPLAAVLQGNYDTPESQKAQLETLQADLQPSIRPRRLLGRALVRRRGRNGRGGTDQRFNPSHYGEQLR